MFPPVAASAPDFLYVTECQRHGSCRSGSGCVLVLPVAASPQASCKAVFSHKQWVKQAVSSVFHVREGSNNEGMCHQHMSRWTFAGSQMWAVCGASRGRGLQCAEMFSMHARMLLLLLPVHPACVLRKCRVPSVCALCPWSNKAIGCHSHSCMPEHAKPTCRVRGSKSLLHTRRAHTKTGLLYHRQMLGSKHCSSTGAGTQACAICLPETAEDPDHIFSQTH